MAPLADDIRNAREAVERLLDEMGLNAFTYTVEQKIDGWTLRVECATDEGWQEATLQVDPHELSASMTDADVRAKLRTDWEPHLRSCAKRRSRSAAQ